MSLVGSFTRKLLNSHPEVLPLILTVECSLPSACPEFHASEVSAVSESNFACFFWGYVAFQALGIAEFQSHSWLVSLQCIFLQVLVLERPASSQLASPGLASAQVSRTSPNCTALHGPSIPVPLRAARISAAILRSPSRMEKAEDEEHLLPQA